jgi:predicted MFS family arabinose efflux permease
VSGPIGETMDQARWRLWSYETGLLLMMSFANGVVAMDRLAVNVLSPFIIADFRLSNTELGLLSSGLSIAIAASGFALASMADATRLRKTILLITLVLFSLFSALSGLATGFLVLLGARVLLGAAEGPICALGQSIVAIESPASRRGVNMGVMQNLGAAALGSTLGPILLSQIAASAGWRSAFFVSGVPGVVLAAIIYFTVRPLNEAAAPVQSVLPGDGREAGVRSIFRSRNLLLSLAIAGLFSAWLIITGIFIPRYLNQVDGIRPTDIGLILGLAGPASAVSGMLAPGVSDRIGRRSVLALMTASGVLLPLAVIFIHGPFLVLLIALFVGGLAAGAGPLYVAIVPSEAVPRRHVATAVALSLGSGEIIGGVAGPFIAGRAADAYGLDAPFWISAGCAAFCAVLSLLLIETAPRKMKIKAVFDSPGVAANGRGAR